MKKLFVMIIIAVILCMGSSLGNADEQFTLRCKINFGDTKDDVKAKEELPIKRQTAERITTESGTVAGIYVHSINYSFDDSGKLVSVLWEKDSKNTLIFDDFSSLSENLCKKYGNPINTDKDINFLIKGAAIEDLQFEMRYLFPIPGYGPLMLNEWTITGDNNKNMKIDLLLYSLGSEDYRLRLSYDIYTDEELALLQEENAAENAKIMNDL